MISARLFAGQSLVHVYSENAPDNSFEPVAAELQDVYFWAIRQHDTDSQPLGAASG